MRGSFFENNKVGDQVNALRLAVMQLSLAGYVVLETHTKSRNEQASIMIDREFAECAFQVSHAAEKSIAWCERWGCRIYWLHCENLSPQPTQ